MWHWSNSYLPGPTSDEESPSCPTVPEMRFAKGLGCVETLRGKDLNAIQVARRPSGLNFKVATLYPAERIEALAKCYVPDFALRINDNDATLEFVSDIEDSVTVRLNDEERRRLERAV
jgi:hypothetical protein